MTDPALFRKIIDNEPFNALERKMIEDALALCIAGHAGQKRRNEDPYHSHPIEVALSVLEFGYLPVVVALLHDVIEDTILELSDLARFFPLSVVYAVDALTKQPELSYTENVARCCTDPLAQLVKLFDMAHNASDLDDGDQQFRKYRDHTKMLLDGISLN